MLGVIPAVPLAVLRDSTQPDGHINTDETQRQFTQKKFGKVKTTEKKQYRKTVKNPITGTEARH